MVVKNMGSALRNCIPQMVGRKITEFFELIKPLVEFKYEVLFHISHIRIYHKKVETLKLKSLVTIFSKNCNFICLVILFVNFVDISFV